MVQVATASAVDIHHVVAMPSSLAVMRILESEFSNLPEVSALRIISVPAGAENLIGMGRKVSV